MRIAAYVVISILLSSLSPLSIIQPKMSGRGPEGREARAPGEAGANPALSRNCDLLAD
jgi:hypothetical protein